MILRARKTCARLKEGIKRTYDWLKGVTRSLDA